MDVATVSVESAADVVVRTGLKVKADESFVVVSDAESAELGEALAGAGARAGARVTVARIDELRSVSTGHTGERPHKVLPDVLRRAMMRAGASAFVASAPHAELSMREQLLHMVAAHGVRHAHMPGISRRAFVAGLRAPLDEVERAGRHAMRRFEGSTRLDVDSAQGTALSVAPEASHRWVPQFGVVAPGFATALPAGALCVPARQVEGVFVADASLGEFMGAREGLLAHKPVRLSITRSRVVAVDVPADRALEREVSALLRMSENSDRVGLVILGVNGGAHDPTGDALVDQTRPGLHLVIGDPAGRVTGVPYRARSSFVACGAWGRVTTHAARSSRAPHAAV